MKKLERLMQSIEKRYRKYANLKFNKIQPKDTPLGFKLVGNESMEEGIFEVEETQLIGNILKNMDCFVNVGANIGYYCCLARQKGVYTYAFEPEPQNLKFLLKNLRANKWEDGIEVFPLALSNKPGIVEIYGGNSGASTGASLIAGWANTPSHMVEIIPATTLDLIMGNRLNGSRTLVLMDIEGAEYFALSGATSLLKQQPKPVWMVEICVHENQPEGVKINPHLIDTFSIFWENDYQAYTATSAPRLVLREEVLSIAAGEKDAFGTYNFIFAGQNIDLKEIF